MTVTIKCSVVKRSEWQNKDGQYFTVTEPDYQSCLNMAKIIYKSILSEKNLTEDEFGLVTLLN